MQPFLRVFILSVIGLIILFKEVAVLGICVGYIFFGLFRYVRRGRPGVEPKESMSKRV